MYLQIKVKFVTETGIRAASKWLLGYERKKKKQKSNSAHTTFTIEAKSQCE